jgi:hypothetical protein
MKLRPDPGTRVYERGIVVQASRQLRFLIICEGRTRSGSCSFGPIGEIAVSDQGVGVLGAQDPLMDGQLRGELVAGPGRISRMPGPASKLVARDKGCDSDWCLLLSVCGVSCSAWPLGLAACRWPGPQAAACVKFA